MYTKTCMPCIEAVYKIIWNNVCVCVFCVLAERLKLQCAPNPPGYPETDEEIEDEVEEYLGKPITAETEHTSKAQVSKRLLAFRLRKNLGLDGVMNTAIHFRSASWSTCSMPASYSPTTLWSSTRRRLRWFWSWVKTPSSPKTSGLSACCHSRRKLSNDWPSTCVYLKLKV